MQFAYCIVLIYSILFRGVMNPVIEVRGVRNCVLEERSRVYNRPLCTPGVARLNGAYLEMFDA